MKKHYTLIAMLTSCAVLLCGETATIDGYTYTYKLVDGGVELHGVWSGRYAQHMHIYTPAIIPLPQGHFNIPEVVSDLPVVSIGDYAFWGCSDLTHVTIPKSVTSIGMLAFDLCTGLEQVTIPSKVTSIGNYAFFNCKNLKSVTIPPTITSIGGYAFGNTAIWHNHPDGIVYIEGWVVGCKYAITLSGQVVLRDGTRGIAGGAFADGINMTSIIIPESVKFIANSAFVRSGLVDIAIPEGVMSIGKYTFWGSTNLTSVTIPASVTSIGEHAFWGCKGLTDVTFSKGVNLMGTATPETLTEIGERAFWDCDSLINVVMLGNVKSIGKQAFLGCKGLRNARARS